jgi:hypothetical protein
MSDIPRARRLLRQALELLLEAESHMTRPTPVRRAKRSSIRCTPEVAAKIRTFATRHPLWSYARIARRFNVDDGRVSESIRGLR